MQSCPCADSPTIKPLPGARDFGRVPCCQHNRATGDFDNMKHYHISFDLDGEVHAVKVWASNEDNAKKMALTKLRSIVEKRGCNLTFDETDICSVEIL